MTTFNFFSQFSESQLKNQYKQNLIGLQKMLNKAQQSGKKINGYTENQLSDMVSKYAELAK